MYNHAPEGYVCPFCLIVNGQENERQDDIVYQNEYVTAFVASGWWKNNKGHVLVIPNEHFENIYDLPIDLSAKLHAVEREIAIAFKETYKCDGVSSRQHNEPSGNQDVWHYHIHVFPRYGNDDLYKTDRVNSNPVDRIEYSRRLRRYFESK